MTDMDTKRQEKLKTLQTNYKYLLGTAILAPKGNISPLPSRMLQLGRNIRETYTRYPTLPGAIHNYQDLASTREWTVSGQPRAAVAAMDWLNNTETLNTKTGMVDVGFDQYLRRRVLDYLCIGATAYICQDAPDSPLEYADPTRLMFLYAPKYHIENNASVIDRVKPDEFVWQHARQRILRNREVKVHYPIPTGDDGFMSPLMHILPMAILAWLIQESDTATVDGRRIRDIIFVNNPTMVDIIEEAVLTQLALWNGANPEDVGIPIIPIQGSQQPVKDMFARLGLSEIPTTLDRYKFKFEFANEISAAIGLALRQFWNEDTTTNRALEQVQEQRQQQKGPSAFVRSEQRLINRSGLLKRFGNSAKLPTRFSFIEEIDSASLKSKAEVLKLNAEAFGLMFDRLGLLVKPASLVAWMQSIGQLPYELEFEEATAKPTGTMLGSDPTPTGQTGLVQEMSDPLPTTAETVEKSMDYGEIVVNQDGRILSKRLKSYSVDIELEKELAPIKAEIESLEEMSESEFLAQLKDEADGELRLQFLDVLEYHPNSLDKWAKSEVFQDLVWKITNNVMTLTEDEEKLWSEMVLSE